MDDRRIHVQEVPAGRATPKSPRSLADAHGLPYVDLARVRLEKEASEAIAFDVLSRTHAAPYKLEGDVLHVAIADPSDLQLIDDLRAMSTFRVEFGVAAREDIDFQLRQIARGLEVHERAEFLEDLPTEEDELEAEDGISDAPPIRLVNSIVLQAAEEGARTSRSIIGSLPDLPG